MSPKFNMIIKLYIDGRWVKKYLDGECQHYPDYSTGFKEYKMKIHGTVKEFVEKDSDIQDSDITELFMQKEAVDEVFDAEFIEPIKGLLN